MKKNMIIGIVVIAIIAIAIFAYSQTVYTTSGPNSMNPDSIQGKCTNTGGSIKTNMCCGSASDFPNTCLIGACGCSPDNSKEVKTCDCGEGKCFNGTSCITQ